MSIYFGRRRFVPVFAVVTSLAALSLSGRFAHAQTKRTFTHESDVETASVWKNFPRWDGDRLIGYYGDVSAAPIIYTINRDARREETLFTFKDANQIMINNIAGSSNGEIAIVGTAFTSDSRMATFLARISPDRNHQIVTRTWPYHPTTLTFASDGSIWTIGNLKDEENTRDIVPGHLLRRFDSDGTLLGSTTIRIKGFHDDPTTFLRSSKDRIGWFTGQEYIEFGLDGKELGRYDGPEGSTERDITGVVVSEDNDVIASRFGAGKAEFLVLDRVRRSWDPVSVAKDHAPAWARALGFDGTILVITTSNGKLSRFKTK